MGVYTHQIQSTEWSVFDRTSGKWTNASKLWDGDISTAPGSQESSFCAKMDMSWLPQGMRLCGVRCGVAYKRTGSGSSRLWLRSTDQTYDPGPAYYFELPEITLPSGTYNVNEWHTAYVELSAEQSSNYLAYKNQYAVITPTRNEIMVEWEYTELGLPPIYVGEKQAAGIYVGSQKASAVYIGDQKIL